VIKSRRGRVLIFSAASFVVALVGFSRIALGAHYLTDVIGGIFFGMMWLTLCLLVARPLRRTALPPVIAEVLPEAVTELVPVPVSVEAVPPASASLI
jgi:undecaprenyl-diphosphatase